jgi:type IV pilus assembly protein PilC
MKHYKWQGTNRFGDDLKGEMWAKNPMALSQSLQRQSILIKKIERDRSFNMQEMKQSDIALLLRQLTTLLSSGLTLTQTLSIIQHQHKKYKMIRMIEELKHDLESGLTVTETFKKHSNQWGDFACHLIEIGEKSGTLTQLFEKIATYLETNLKNKKKIKEVLRYPTLVLCLSVLMTIGLFILVIPQFERLFNEFNASLPLPTQAVILISKGLCAFGPQLLLILIGGYCGFQRLCQFFPKLKRKRDQFFLKVPVVKELIQQTTLARFHEMLAVTFSAGYPLIDGIKCIAQATPNQLYSTAIYQMSQLISQGYTLQAAMKETKLFPSLTSQMITVGEESGTLGTILFKMGIYYHDQSVQTIKRLEHYLEPLIMITLGFLIGGMVISMYLPILTLGMVI